MGLRQRRPPNSHGDPRREAPATRGATTILRIAPDGRLALHRTGAHDAGLSAEEYLRRLGALDEAERAPPCHF
jgi:hypothetical protein